ncbi:MAG TPA: hypothetical protein VGL63_13895 [Streptosporangiaceae bacterium]
MPVAALLGSVVAVSGIIATPQAAWAGSQLVTRQVWAQYFSGPTQVNACNAAGQAGVNAGRWDFYNCTPVTSGLFAGDTYGAGYLITG